MNLLRSVSTFIRDITGKPEPARAEGRPAIDPGEGDRAVIVGAINTYRDTVY